MLPFNPADRAKPPRKATRTIDTLPTPEEAKQLLAAADQHRLRLGEEIQPYRPKKSFGQLPSVTTHPCRLESRIGITVTPAASKWDCLGTVEIVDHVVITRTRTIAASPTGVSSPIRPQEEHIYEGPLEENAIMSRPWQWPLERDGDTGRFHTATSMRCSFRRIASGISG